MRAGLRTIAAMICLAAGAPGCSSAGQPADTDGSTNGATVTVYAAASMKTTFTALGRSFEASHPGTRVAFNFAGSHVLAEQIIQGASADVFASANATNMATVTGAGLNATGSEVYATNQLSIAVAPGNPTGIVAFKDLANPGLKLVVCAPAAPCGAATVELEEVTGVTLAPVSEELGVSDVMAKVKAGEADAGLVYRTDVIAAGDKVKGVEFPESARAINQNFIVALKAGPQVPLGHEFVDLVLSGEGRKVLASAGFGAAG